MKKISVVLFGISLLGISLYGIMNQVYYINILMNLSEPYMIGRAALVGVLLAYAFIPALRIYVTKALLGIAGVVLLVLGLVIVGSPTLLGRLDEWFLLGDVLTLIEGGILATVLSAELPARRTRFVANSINSIKTYSSNHPGKLSPKFSPTVPSLLSSKALKTQP